MALAALLGYCLGRISCVLKLQSVEVMAWVDLERLVPACSWRKDRVAPYHWMTLSECTSTTELWLVSCCGCSVTSCVPLVLMAAECIMCLYCSGFCFTGFLGCKVPLMSENFSLGSG